MKLRCFTGAERAEQRLAHPVEGPNDVQHGTRSYVALSRGTHDDASIGVVPLSTEGAGE